MAAVERIEGWRSLGDNIIETIINKSEKVKELKNKAKERELTEKQKKQLTDEEKEYRSKRKLVQEKLIKFATRIPAFMYLTDFRENTLQDVITKLEPDLFLAVTGLTVKDFHLLVRLKLQIDSPAFPVGGVKRQFCVLPCSPPIFLRPCHLRHPDRGVVGLGLRFGYAKDLFRLRQTVRWTAVLLPRVRQHLDFRFRRQLITLTKFVAPLRLEVLRRECIDKALSQFACCHCSP
jgi:hypothetical protein